jgi:hypothetical protein
MQECSNASSTTSHWPRWVRHNRHDLVFLRLIMKRHELVFLRLNMKRHNRHDLVFLRLIMKRHNRHDLVFLRLIMKRHNRHDLVFLRLIVKSHIICNRYRIVRLQIINSFQQLFSLSDTRKEVSVANNKATKQCIADWPCAFGLVQGTLGNVLCYAPKNNV